MMQTMNKGIPVVISGPSGSGKGTIVKELLKKYGGKLELSVSATTRPPRVGEMHGREYYFISNEEFEKRIAQGEILEYTSYCGAYYGTPKRELLERTERGIHVLLEIEVEGSQNVRRQCADAIHIFVLPPDKQTLEKRLRGRGTNTEDDILRRLARAKEEMKYFPTYDYYVINEDGGAAKAADEIYAIICAEQKKTLRNPDIAANFFS